ncbi:S8 family serine peptidase [Amycolatopsis sp. A133]|uniref:S8 family peptidase n=1 Tax=Amycolatopsis sp. A133 TaxID=3064472 RepID=UPI0027FCF61B|nr:S8 family serine peptidase [Amycolatopsis sp. A133]MDQ7808826.1 S8 family serine peptidase [Amycolatopsis sp. A133]
MVVRFDPPEPQRPGDPGPGTPGFVPAISPELLDRHGGRVLDPDVNVVEGWPVRGGRYRPTVYRPGVLLVPAEIWEAKNSAINDVLGQIELRAETPEILPSRAPVRIALRPREDGISVSVDSWRALQHLRASVPPPDVDGEPDADRQGAALTRADVLRCSLEHLIATTDDTLVLKPWAISDTPATNSLRSSFRGRFPVVLPGAAPHREPAARRPVIAVVDSGHAAHPLLDVHEAGPGSPFADQFVTVSPDIQDEIARNHSAGAFPATRIIEGYTDAPESTEPLVGALEDAYGHGTFIAGLIRQAAPRARVLAIRAVHSDKIGYSGDALTALHEILAQVIDAQDNGRPERMVDVVSFSAGYYDEWDGTSALIEVVDGLIGRGVVVVAAAGNESTARPFLPAALADRPGDPDGGPQVIGVGALNPDGSKALFSNENRSVTAWASGVNVVSTYPPAADGSETPERAVPGLDRYSLDPDKFTGEYAVWSGTSFATPLVAAEIANRLLRVGEERAELALTRVDRDTTVERARAALPEMP